MKRMKRTALLLAALLLALAAFACAEDAPEALGEEDFVFVYEEIPYSFGTDPAELIAAMTAHDGAAPEIFAAESCLYDTMDYEYNGAEITVGSCHPQGGPDEAINCFIVYTGEWTTARGIGIGSTLEDVIRVYGTDYAEEADTVVYAIGEKYQSYTLAFQIDPESRTVICFALYAMFDT